MYATKESESIDIVRLLLERKDLDLDEKDIDGKTAEDFASEIQNTRAVKMIREERLRRMGKLWTKEISDEDDEESELEERNSTPELRRGRKLAYSEGNTFYHDTGTLPCSCGL